MGKSSFSGNLKDWINSLPPDVFVGTSLILCHEGRFLFGIRAPKDIDGQIILELTGIGGALEPEDYTLTSGARREAVEELGVDVSILPSEETLVVRSPQNIEHIHFTGSERPIAVIFRGFRTPPHMPWHTDNHGHSCLVIFQAKLEEKPRPAMELPYLIWLQPEQILALAQDDITIGKLQKIGAELITGPMGFPALDWQARLTDSQEALALALGENTADFYSTCCSNL